MSDGGQERLASDEIETLLKEHGAALRSFLWGVLRDSQLADDAMQSAVAKMVEKGHHARPASRKAWLFQVAYHEAMALRRRQATHQRLLERAGWQRPDAHCETPESHAIRRENVETMRQALNALPEKQRQVVSMRIYEGKTFAAIADELQIPLGTALTRMRAALSKLAAIWQDGKAE